MAGVGKEEENEDDGRPYVRIVHGNARSRDPSVRYPAETVFCILCRARKDAEPILRYADGGALWP